MADLSQAAIAAAGLIDTLEEDYADEEIKVERVMVVVELSGALDTDEEWTGVFYRCNDQKRWIQYGMLDAAKRAVQLHNGEDEES